MDGRLFFLAEEEEDAHCYHSFEPSESTSEHDCVSAEVAIIIALVYMVSS